MSYLRIKNRASGALNADVTDSATTWYLQTGQGARFPNTCPFHVTCEDEIVRVTAINGDTLTVQRAQEGTTAAAHPAGASVELRITAAVLENRQASDIVYGRFPLSRLGWASGNLLKGAGIDADPTEEKAGIYCIATRTADLSVPNNSETVVPFDSELYDTDDIHDNTTNNERLTCKTAGLYLVYFYIVWDINNNGFRMIRVSAVLGGTTYTIQQFRMPTVATSNIVFGTTAFVPMAVNDYCYLLAYQNSGSSLAIKLTANAPRFGMVRII